MMTITLPSRFVPEVPGASVPIKINGNISVHFTNSHLMSELISPHFDNDGRYFKVSLVKNLPVFPILF